MKLLKNVALLLLLSVVPTAYAADSNCESVDSLHFVCGPKSAEDLVLVQGTNWIIASSFVEGVGLYLIDARDGTWSVLPLRTEHDPAFPNCTTPPPLAKLVTHGLNLRDGAGGRSTLYVVGHGGREAIEIFDVDTIPKHPIVTWKGCVPMPDGLAANSVAAFADGSFVATVPLMPGSTFAEALGGKVSGTVVRWSPGSSGFETLQGTELAYNNGIEVSPDGREIFVASSGSRTVVAFSNTNPATQLRVTRTLAFIPDNVHLGSGGRLLTAGMKVDEPACGGARGAQDFEKLSSCPRGAIAAAIDPSIMADAVLVETPAIPVFSNATMVLTIGDQFWLGTFSGDRIAYGSLR
jgi:SMP-30/Gluconolactonase/LRE-like region